MEEKPPEGESKVKRKMKNAFQLELLERTFRADAYPSELIRAELSEQLGLSDRQLQMWFCHRRMKDRKPITAKLEKKDADVAASCSGGAGDDEHYSVSVSGSSLFGHNIESKPRFVPRTNNGVAVARISTDLPPLKRHYEPPQSVTELRAVTAVESQLGEQLREDGPILGMEFDPLPPGAFGAPIDTVGQQKPAARPYEFNSYERPIAKPVKSAARAFHEYQFLPEQPSLRDDTYERVTPSHYIGPPPHVPIARSTLSTEQIPSVYSFQGQPSLRDDTYDDVARKNSNIGVDAHLVTQPLGGLETPMALLEMKGTPEEEAARIEKKRKANMQSDEARIAKEVDAHEKRIRKELEKQDILRRKREEQMRKEMEKQDRERRKEEERLLREKQREEERYQREQKREIERREKFMQKEFIRAEKMRVKEQHRREKEAARQKAANERATARRIVKESMELIDDERLELMELAATNKGLPSIVSLNSEDLHSLDLFKDKLVEFPPKSVRLKKPFAIQPWINSEENVGNLLMVWRFLITFADLLNLWPFTLDEFIQSFHDYDSRLLNEIHVSLLKCIIKDIEDVARTPSCGLGSTQSNAVNPCGGHPHIVEGAYAWGFDILSWKKHLNYLTWPEILRQFALSAGFGPKLKKNNLGQTHLHDENEGNDGNDIISNLRSGVAAEKAVATMKKRGFSNSRRSRHRLTPGTVKYAAFHVLSLEGSDGLTILEVADKIQRSGLRDLTTSKTPEASITAALSRDTKLFERTAPSTYCIRTPYRKDPIDAETILSSAREKIQIFKNGFVNEEEAEDVENDDDSESDAAEDEEVAEADRCIQETVSNDWKKPLSRKEETIVYENSLCETWVQGLTEGEYCDLSVEERLNAIVALVCVANEGNSVRVVLEERMETANSLKKQMWIEAQLDKRRIKEEYLIKIQHTPFISNKTEPSSQVSYTEAEQNPESFTGLDTISLLQSGHVAEKSRSELKAYVGHKAEELYVYRSLPLGLDRRRNRYWQFKTSGSINDPGSGRIFVELRNGVWTLIDTEEDFDSLVSSLDIRGSREYHLHSMLQKIEISFKETLKKNKSLFNNVNTEKAESSSSNTLEISSSFIIKLEGKDFMKRYRDFETWMWKECLISPILCAMKYGKQRCKPMIDTCDDCRDLYLIDGNHCQFCHKMYKIYEGGSSFSQHVAQCKERFEGKVGSSLQFDLSLPLRIRLLKGLFALMEVNIPIKALQSLWSEDLRKSFGETLHAASSAADIFQILTSLESSIQKDFLSSDFETTVELLGSRNELSSVVLPWIPNTSSAVGLRLMELDSSLSFMPNQKIDMLKHEAAGNFITPPPKFIVASEKSEEGFVEASYEPETLNLDRWIESENLHPTSSRGRAPRGRGRGRSRVGRPPKRTLNSRTKPSPQTRTPKYRERLVQLVDWKGRPRARGGRKRGRPSLANSQTESKQTLFESNLRRLVPVPQWGRETMQSTSSGSERLEYNDDFNNYDSVFTSEFKHDYKIRGMENEDERELENDVDDDEEDGDDDIDIRRYINGDSDDAKVSSSSSEYSN